MHVHEYRLHPDWIARLEMFRQFASRTPAPDASEPAEDVPAAESALERWPLPKISYRHRSTFSPKPR